MRLRRRWTTKELLTMKLALEDAASCLRMDGEDEARKTLVKAILVGVEQGVSDPKALAKFAVELFVRLRAH
jgi:hypothetical protein